MIKILHSLVLSTYHAKFYLKIRTGSQVILTLFLGFGLFAIARFKKDRAHQK